MRERHNCPESYANHFTTSAKVRFALVYFCETIFVSPLHLREFPISHFRFAEFSRFYSDL